MNVKQAREATQGFLGEKLQQVGNFMGGVDDAYSKRIRENLGGLSDDKVGDLHQMGGFAGARAVTGQLLGVKRNQTMFDTEDPRYNQLLDSSVKNTLVASRYAIPAAGVTAAGAGLMELTKAFGGEADTQPPQQIQM